MRRRLLLACLPGLLAACAGSPPADLYTLATVPGTPVHTTRRSIELRRIGLPGYLDRPEIVRSAADYRLAVTGNDRWAEPFGRMIDRVLIEDLSARLPDATVFAESGAISTDADNILEVQVQRFDADASGAVLLLAQVALRRDGGGGVPPRTLRLTATPGGPGTAEQVAAMSAALGQLADAVAALVAEGRPGRPQPAQRRSEPTSARPFSVGKR